MTPLPSHFQFSQASLQDYADCPRRFQLRYVERVAWPALEAEPALENERRMQLGLKFHRLVHQRALGIPEERLSRSVNDADLRRWWHNYLVHGPDGLPPARYPEITLSAPLGDCRLVAKYDLVAVEAGQRAVIVDWKTSRKRPRRSWLAGRMQTKVYPYLLVRAGAHLNGGVQFDPDQVNMVYWFAEYPDEPGVFTYDAAQYQAAGADLTALVEQAVNPPYPRTSDEQHCRYCRYKSLCQRGVEAGALAEMEGESESRDFGLPDLEQIAEIEY